VAAVPPGPWRQAATLRYTAEAMDRRLSLTLLGIFVAAVLIDVVVDIAIESLGASHLIAFVITLAIVVPFLILTLSKLAKV
jgi:hypothetical protein